MIYFEFFPKPKTLVIVPFCVLCVNYMTYLLSRCCYIIIVEFADTYYTFA